MPLLNSTGRVILIQQLYPRVPNKRGDWNEQGGWKKSRKLISDGGRNKDVLGGKCLEKRRIQPNQVEKGNLRKDFAKN